MQFLIISLLFLIAERLMPQRTRQGLLRRGIFTDLLHWAFNGYAFYLGYSVVVGAVFAWFTNTVRGAGLGGVFEIHPVSAWALPLQFAVLFIVQDFLMWCTHNLLHRVPLLWKIHRVHHSVTTMDWFGNMRYHWGEIVVYNLVMFFPLMLLGADASLFVYIVPFNTFIGHFNHANINVDIGPLKYVFNSPRMHIWHHDRDGAASHNKNFAIGLSAWDWIFGTAYLPDEHADPEPRTLGFEGIDEFPATFLGQQLFPLSLLWRRSSLFALLVAASLPGI